MFNIDDAPTLTVGRVYIQITPLRARSVKIVCRYIEHCSVISRLWISAWLTVQKPFAVLCPSIFNIQTLIHPLTYPHTQRWKSFLFEKAYRYIALTMFSKIQLKSRSSNGRSGATSYYIFIHPSRASAALYTTNARGKRNPIAACCTITINYTNWKIYSHSCAYITKHRERVFSFHTIRDRLMPVVSFHEHILFFRWHQERRR